MLLKEMEGLEMSGTTVFCLLIGCHSFGPA